MDNCIFENKPCQFAHKEGNAFDCKAPSDDEMPCKEAVQNWLKVLAKADPIGEQMEFFGLRKGRHRKH